MMEVKWYHTDTGFHLILIIKRGRSLIHVVTLTPKGVGVRRVPQSEERYMTEVSFNGKPYPIARAKRQMKRSGKHLGISKAARRVLV